MSDLEKLRNIVQSLLVYTDPVADLVYNDNGDMTVTGVVTPDQIMDIHLANRRAHAALKGKDDEHGYHGY